MDKNYYSSTSASIELIPPKGYVLSKTTFDNIPIRLFGKGYDLIRARRKAHRHFQVTIPRQEGQIKLRADQLSLLINNQVEENVRIQVENLNDIELKADKDVSKRLAIKIQSEIQYRQGFTSVNGIQLEIDSVTVSGAKSILDTMRYVYTEKLSKKDVSGDIIGELAFLNTNKLDIVPNTVSFSLDIVPLTEKKLSIQVSKFFKEKKVLSVPEEIIVELVIPFQTYDQITESNLDIRLVPASDIQSANMTKQYVVEVSLDKRLGVIYSYEPKIVKVYELVN